MSRSRSFPGLRCRQQDFAPIRLHRPPTTHNIDLHIPVHKLTSRSNQYPIATMVGGPQATTANLTPLGPRRRLVSSVSTATVAPTVCSGKLELVDAISALGILSSPPSTTATHKNDEAEEQHEPADIYEHSSRHLLRRDTAVRTRPTPNSGDAVDAHCPGPNASAANLVPLGLARWEPAEAIYATTIRGHSTPFPPPTPPVQVDTHRLHPQRSRSPLTAYFERPSRRDREYHQQAQPIDTYQYGVTLRRDSLRRERSRSSHRHRGHRPSAPPSRYRHEEYVTRDHRHMYHSRQGSPQDEFEQGHQRGSKYNPQYRSPSPLYRGRESPCHDNGYPIHSRRRSRSPDRIDFDQPWYGHRQDDRGRRVKWHADQYLPRREGGRY
jgi:hypothetical protein